MLPNITVLLSSPEGIMGSVIAAGAILWIYTRTNKPPQVKWFKRKRR